MCDAVVGEDMEVLPVLPLTVPGLLTVKPTALASVVFPEARVVVNASVPPTPAPHRVKTLRQQSLIVEAVF